MLYNELTGGDGGNEEEEVVTEAKKLFRKYDKRPKDEKLSTFELYTIFLKECDDC